MKKHVAPIVVGAAVLVAGCGTTGAGSLPAAGGTPEPASHGTPDPHPTAAPWPHYDVDDYTYRLRTMCFCANRGDPVIVTVRDGKAIDAVYAHRGWGHAAGDSAAYWMRLSVNDVIDAANDQHADQVRVRWPDGQAYPSSVWVDPDAGAADEEIGYSIGDLTPD
jgi:major membrane immunogen (membrane-anchored lipoprotein)